MLKYFCLDATVSVALTGLITDIAFSRPLPASSQFPEVQNSNIDVPLCYIQTPDGRTLDLGKLCGRNSAASGSKTPYSQISPSQFRRGSVSGYASDSV